MQTVYALPGIARRWSGLTTLIALATTVTLVRLTTLSPAGIGMGGARISPTSFFMLHPNLGWDYFGFLMNGHGFPSFGGPQPSFGGGSPVAGPVTKSEGQGQKDPDLTGTELASGRKAKEDAEGKEGKSNADTLNSGLAHPRGPGDAEHDAGVTGPDSVNARRTGKDAEAFHRRIVSLGGVATYPETRFSECIAGCPSADSILRSYRNASWYENDAYPFLDSVFPGVRLVKVAVGIHGQVDYFVVFRDGYTRGLNDLNTIMEDRGFSFDSSEMNTIAKIAVLFMYVQHRPIVRPKSQAERETEPMTDGFYYAAPSGIPAIAFKSFKREFVTKAGLVRGGKVTVECEVDGVERTVAVTFHSDARSRYIPGGIWTPDGVIQYAPWRMPKTGSGGGGRRGSLGSRGTLAVGGDVWQEYRGLPGNNPSYFVCVQKDNAATNDTVRFVLSGYESLEQDVKLVFARTQDAETTEIPVSINSNGYDTIEWAPTIDSTGEYSIYGRDAQRNETYHWFVDVEACVDTIDAANQVVRAHYMLRNGTDTTLSSRELADSILAFVRAAWQVEQPWLGAGVYPTASDTLHVTLGGVAAKYPVTWFHTACIGDPGFVPLDEPRRYWIHIPDDFDTDHGYYDTWYLKARPALAHELWHACGVVARGDTDFPRDAYPMYAWIEEGQAACVAACVYPGIELSKQVTSYQTRAWAYLDSHDLHECRRYNCDTLQQERLRRYRYCLYWRHLYEHSGAANPGALLAEVHKNLDSFFVQTKGASDAVAAHCRRVITAALDASGATYQSFDASLIEFNRYCCLTQRENGTTPYWDSGGPPPHTVYTELTPAAGRYLFFGTSSKLWEPADTARPHSSHIYHIVRDTSVRHRDSTTYVHFDCAPGNGPSYAYTAGVIFIKGGEETFEAFASGDSGVISKLDTAWDTMYVHVTYLDTITRANARYRLLVTDGSRDVKPESTRPRDGEVFYLPSGGQKDAPPVYTTDPTVWRLINLGGSLDSFPVQCVVNPLYYPDSILYDQTETTYVAPGDTDLFRFKEPYNFGDKGLGFFRMTVHSALPNDSNVRNDTVSVVFQVRDTGLERKRDRTEQNEYVQYPGPNGEQQDFAEHYPDFTEGWRSKHQSYQASCWHQRQTESEFPWPDHDGKYMCLRWHGRGPASDWLWTPLFDCGGRGNLKAKLQMHLESRHDTAFSIAIGLGCLKQDGGEVSGPTLFSYNQNSTPYTLNCDTSFDLTWDGCPNSSQVYLCFSYNGKDSSSIVDWCIDSFRVVSDTVPGFDVGAQEIMNPGPWSLFADGEAVTPMVKVRNYGCTQEHCDVHLQILDRDSIVVYDNVREGVEIPLYSFVKVAFPPWIAYYPNPGNHVEYSFVAWTEMDGDECPENDSCIRSAVPVVTRGFHNVSNYPLGKTPKGTALASDGTFLYAKNGKKPTFYRFYPPNSGNPGNSGGWDTLPMLSFDGKKPNGRGGMVFVPDDSFGKLYVHWKKKRQLARLDLTHPETGWQSKGSFEGLNLGQPMCYDGQDTTIFALNRVSSKFWQLLGYSVSESSWRVIDGLPGRMKNQGGGGMSLVGRKLYIAGFKDQRNLFVSLDLDTGVWDTLEPFPNTCNNVTALTTVNDTIYLIKDKDPRCVARYDITGNTWMQSDSTPLLKEGTCLATLGRSIYLFDGAKRKDQELWRYVVPTGGATRWQRPPPALKQAPRFVLAAGQLYGTPKEWPGTDPGGGQEMVIDTSGTDAATPRWSSDGSQLVYTKWDTADFAQVWRCPASGGSPQQLTFDQCDKENPDCSPAAQYVLYHYTDDEGYSRIGRVNLDGSGQTALSPAYEDCEDGRWSTDGSYIAYLRQDANDRWQVWRMGPDGANRQQLTYGTDGDCLDPAPSDSFVAYAKECDGFSQIFCVSAQGTDETQLTDKSFEHRLPNMSPTSAWITYECDDSTGYTQIRRVQRHTLEEAVVTSSNCENEAPSYTSDGQYIIFTASDNAGTQVCEVPAPGDSIEPLTPVAWGYDECRSSPDSRWVVYAKEDTLYPDVGIVKVRRFRGGGLSVFSLDKTVFDATRDSVRVDFSIESDANVTLVARQGTSPIRMFLNNARLAAGDYQFCWSGQQDGNSSLALPDTNYNIKITAADSGWSDRDSALVTLKGTLVPATITSNTTWTAANEPYVLTGHSLDINHDNGYPPAVLTIEPGVRVMFADSGVSRSIIVHSADQIVANGSSQDSIYFMPYRKMAEPYNPAKRGWWGGISFTLGSNGGQFSYCVFENGGNCDPATVVDVHQLSAGAHTTSTGGTSLI
jgi:Tol biopolymer transport system component